MVWLTGVQALAENYESWATGHFGNTIVSDPAKKADLWGEHADPDRDGLKNLLEYLGNLDPNVQSDHSEFYEVDILPDGNDKKLVLSVWQRTDDPDLIILPQLSLNLGIWSPDASGDPSTWSSTNSPIYTNDTGEQRGILQRFESHSLSSISAEHSAFIRLSVGRAATSVYGPAIYPAKFTTQPFSSTDSTIQSNQIIIGGFSGSVPISVSGSARIFVNGEDRGSSTTVSNGDVVWIETTTPPTANTFQNVAVSLGDSNTTWSYGTRAQSAIPDHPGDASGYTQVQTNVSESGAAQISIPIAISPGVAGMEPKLAINYSSQGGNGMMGGGFSLSGLSAISRAGKTIAHDGEKGGVAFDENDRFTLDGQRLIAINGVDGADSTEYRTEIDSFSRIISHGIEGSGPQWFSVETKSGLRHEYGNSVDSRIKPEGSASPLSWALTRIFDTFGNSVQFQYEANGATRGEMLPTRIDYTSNSDQGLLPNQVVSFTYEDRSDSRNGYTGGFGTNTTKRLATISSTSAQGDLVRRYLLDYAQDRATGFSLLRAVTEEFQSSSRPTFIQWSQSQFASFEESVSATTYPTEMGTTWSGNPNAPFASDPPSRIVQGDFNKDGIGDFVQINDYTASRTPYSHYLALGRPTGGFDFSQGIPGLEEKRMYSAVRSRLRVGDFNGDGASDLLHIVDDANDNWVALSDATGSFTLLEGESALGDISNQMMEPSFKSELLTLDVTGDGRTDVVYLEAGEMAVHVSNGDGSFEKVSNTGLETVDIEFRGAYINWGWTIPGDFNGDGLVDILYAYRRGVLGTPDVDSWLALSNGDGTFTVSLREELGDLSDKTWDNNHPQLVSGDYNGDGLTDVLCLNPIGFGDDWIVFSRGDGTFEDRPFSEELSEYNLSAQGSVHLVTADLNGDGLTDLFNADYVAGSSSSWDRISFAALSLGDGQFDVTYQENIPSLVGMPYNRALESRVMAGDFDGDGKVEIFHLERESRHYLAEFSDSDPPIVSGVTHAHGGIQEFEYAPLTDHAVHTPRATLNYPCHDFSAPIRVVASHSSDDGTGGSRVTSYAYEGAWTCLNGRGFQGFQARTVTDETTGIVSRTEYDRRELVAGRPILTRQTLADGTLIQESENTWELDETVHPNGNKTYFIRNASSISREFETSNPGAPSYKTTTSSGSIYDDFGNLLEMTVAYGNGYTERTVNTYDNVTASDKWHLGRLRRAEVTKTAAGIPAQSRCSSFAYHPGTGVLVRETIEPESGVHPLEKTYIHDGVGNIVESRLRNLTTGETRTTITRYTADKRFVAETENALGHVETKTYDSLLGNVLTQTGPNGLTTAWEYDGFGRPLREMRADGTETRTFYRKVTASTLAVPPRAVHYVRTQSTGGSPSTTWFDLLDREIARDAISFDGRIVRTHMVYNDRGEVTHQSEPFFLGDVPLYTATTYDAVGRPLAQTAPGNRVTSTVYNGLTVSVTNPNSQTMTRINDVLGRTVDSEDNANQSVIFTRDAFGNLSSVSDPAGNVTTMLYDIRGNKTSMTEPNSGTTSYVYNAFGELISQTDAKNQTVTLQYDLLGRLVQRDEPEGRSVWEYDTAAKGIGKLARVYTTNNAYERIHRYDDLGRPSGTVYRHGARRFAVSNSFDQNSRPDTLTYPTGFAVRNIYNERGHLDEVQNAEISTLCYWTALKVNERGQVEEELLGNGMVTQRDFDPERGLLESIKTGRFHGSDIQNLDYQFDDIGNLLQRRDLRETIPFVEDYEYDTVNRLKRVNATSSLQVNIDYYANGNINSRSDVGVYNHGQNGAGPNAVTSITGSLTGKNNTYTHDANGNRTASSDTTLAYSSFNKPTSITKGSNMLLFDYAPDRSRYQQTQIKGVDQTVKDYVGGMFEREADTDGTVRNIHFIRGGSGVVAIHTKTQNTTTNESLKTRYLHRDHLGSVESITDESGNLSERLSYDAWGQRRSVTFAGGIWTVANYSGTPAETDRGFTGHEMLDAVGLIHMNGRVYDPVIGRFLSPDPFVKAPENLQSLNRYSYVLNNPLSFTDPSGFFFKKIFKAVANFISDNWRTIAAVGVGLLTGYGFTLLAPALGISSTVGLAALGGTGYGFGSAFSGTLLAGGSIGDALRAGLKGAAISGATAALTAGLAHKSVFDLHNVSADSYGKIITKGIVHGAVQGGSSELQGGDFIHGFWAGALSGATSPLVANYIPDGFRTVSSAIVGGTASELGGGKFSNGAISGAMIYLYNQDDAKSVLERIKDAFSGSDLVIKADNFLNGTRGQQSWIFRKGELFLKSPLGKSINLHATVGGFAESPSLDSAIDVAGLHPIGAPLAAGKFAGGLIVQGGNDLAVVAFGQDSVTDAWLWVGDSWAGAVIDVTANAIKSPWR